MSTTSKMVTLRSSDGEEFVVDEALALQSPTIKRMMEDNMRTVIPLPKVKGNALAKVVEYCKKRVESPIGDDCYGKVEQELKAWDAQFVDVNYATLSNIGKAAGYLEINSLCSLLRQTRETRAVRRTSRVLRLIDAVVVWCFTAKPPGGERVENAWFFVKCLAGFAAMLYMGVPMFKAFVCVFFSSLFIFYCFDGMIKEWAADKFPMCGKHRRY